MINVSQLMISQLYVDHSARLYSQLMSKCKNADLAQDIVQDTFVRVIQNHDKIQEGKEASFITTIANNLFIDFCRREKVRYSYAQLPKVEYCNENPEFQLLSKEYRGHLDELLHQMHPKVREVFVLNKIEKKTYKEIASIIGLSVKSVEKRMGQALAMFNAFKNRA